MRCVNCPELGPVVINGKEIEKRAVCCLQSGAEKNEDRVYIDKDPPRDEVEAIIDAQRVPKMNRHQRRAEKARRR